MEAFVFMLTTQFEKEPRATRKKSILGKLTILWIHMKSSTFAGVTSNSSIIEKVCFDRCILSSERYLFYQVTVVCTLISANNGIMYAFLYLSDFLRRFSTRRACSMYLLLTNFAIIGLGRVCGRVVIIWAAGLPTRWTAWKRNYEMLLIFPSSFLTVFPECLWILNSLSLYIFPKRSVF